MFLGMYLIAFVLTIFGHCIQKTANELALTEKNEKLKLGYVRWRKFFKFLSTVGFFSIPIITIAYGIKLIIG